MITIIGNITTEAQGKPAVVIAATDSDDLPTNVANGSVAFIMASGGTTTKMFDEENSAWRAL